jgi:hypothetical protein
MKSPLLLVLLLLAAPASAQRTGTLPASKPVEDSQLYRNAVFGFRYRIPYGWVERTKEMQEGNDAAKGEVLLAIFERPPQAAGDSVNSSVVIGAEKASAFLGLKKAEDYLGTLTESAASKGFKADGDPSEMQIDSQRLIRADFARPLSDKLTVHQATLVMLAKGEIVSFMFIADSADEVNGLIDRLDFSSPKSKAK